MYEQFYGLTGRPFQLTPDHTFFFESTVHQKAAAYLLFGLSQGEGFIVITGEVGAGKTTLLQHLLSTLDPKKYVAAHIVTSQLSASVVLQMVADAFGLHCTKRNKASILSAMEKFLEDNHRINRRCLLVIDEAQNLSIGALEELRMLSNFQVGNHSPMQSILIGQPQFRRLLASPDVEQLRQRVIASYHLGPLGESESSEYIRHRLEVVGWRHDPEFTRDSLAAIYRHTGGVPRRINTLVSRLLLFGVLDQAHSFTAQMVDCVAEELGNETGAVLSPAGDQGVASEEATDILRRLGKVEQSCARLDRTFRHVVQLLADNLKR